MATPGIYITESTKYAPVPSSAITDAVGVLVADLPQGPGTLLRTTSWYQFSDVFGGLSTNKIATFGANLFFRSGGGELYVQRVVHTDAVAATGVLKTTDASTWITFTAKGKGAYGNSLRVKLVKNSANLWDLTVLKEAGVADTIASGLVTAGSDDDTILESFTNLDLATFGHQDVVNILALRSNYVTAAWFGASSAKTIAAGTSFVIPLASGADGSAGLDYTGVSAALGGIGRPLVIFAPGVTDTTVLNNLVTIASANNGFVVVDTAAGVTASAAVTYAGTLTASSYAGVYTPWLWVPDPTSASRDGVAKVPPSGAVAGVLLATDIGRGVFQTPAGPDVAIAGVVAIETTWTSSDLDTLAGGTPPVNPIRIVPGSGAVVMGGRTLKTTDSTRYINIRRSLNHLTYELKSRLLFAVYKNNDRDLWNQAKTVVDGFLTSFWQQGGLRGGRKQDAFYVKIDSDNNSANDIANGILNVEVGVALQYPAEFIRINLTQQTGN
jgi:uncharacterized protein